MSRLVPRRGWALAALLALAGCDSGSVDPAAEGRLALQIVLSPELASAPDAGTLHVEGPTTRTVPLAPGQTVTVDNLQPGSYTLSLEAFASGQVVGFGRTTVNVAAGQDRQVTITPANFVPTGLTVPEQVAAGEDFTVTFQGVQNADGYVVQWADNAQFSNAQTQTTDGTSATLAVQGEGTVFVRVFARSPFGSNGEPAPPAQVQVAASNKLQNGVPLQDRQGGSGSLTFYTFDVPEGGAARVLQVRIRGGSGDADLAIRHGQEPTTGAFDCASVAEPDDYNGNGLDFCSVLDPAAGTWHVMLQGVQAYSGVVLDARLIPLETVPLGGSISDLSGGTSDVLYFNVDLPPAGAPPAGAVSSRTIAGSDVMGASKGGSPLLRRDAPARRGPEPAPLSGTLHLETSGGSGDPDLLATPRLSPFDFSTIAGWPCISATSETSEEACDVSDPEEGPWTVVILGFKTFSGATLSADFAAPMHAFTVTATGSGTVSGGPIDCSFTDGAGSGTCAADVPGGTAVTLVAEPADGYQFDGWSGAGCSGTGDCEVTVGDADVSVEASFAEAVAPTISNPSVTIVEVNSPTCSNGGTSVELTLDYDNPDGDIGANVPVRTIFTFRPGGQTGEVEQSHATDGSGTAGSVTSNYCIVFGTNTEVTLAASITDQHGNRSNEVEVVVPKPAGATAPGRPGAVGGR